MPSLWSSELTLKSIIIVQINIVRSITLQNIRRKMKEGKLTPDKAKVLEEVLNLRHTNEHTGGCKKHKTLE